MKGVLQRLAEDHTEKRPEATAVVLRDERATYSQLEELSNQMARLLRSAGCQKGDRVCLLMPKSPMAIASILGVLKAGCIYVPLDVASPAARVAQMISAADPRCVLVDAPVATLLDELRSNPRVWSGILVGWMGVERVVDARYPEFTRADCASYSAGPVDYGDDPEDPAYIMFTSGSTGVPKGVVITHSNVMHFIEWANKYFGLGPSDRVSGHPPLHFDLSVFDIFGTLAAGAQLHLVAPELNLPPGRLARFIRDNELTQWFSVPSVLTYMAKFDAVRFSDFPALRRLLWCGEVLPMPVLAYWMKRLPAVAFTNLYGPTETTIASSYYTIPGCPQDEGGSIPIGTACEGEELLVLSDQLQPVPHGEIGELCIRGVGLSPGYWRDPERTAAAFVANPIGSDPGDRVYRTGDLARVGDDGLVYFLGRRDSQIKSRGYRIELGDIEACLDRLPVLKESAIVAISTDGFEGATICCAYVPLASADVTPIRLRKELAQALPNYMLPSRWLPVEALPRNANGKIDRKQLREEFQRRAS